MIHCGVLLHGLALAPAAATGRMVSLSPVDLAIIIIYFAAVLGIGFYLKNYAKRGEDFFVAGREMTAWVAGLAFISANLGSLELLGWAGNAYQYGILAAHWYWVGAIPAMLFLALIMMPFYYICKTHSVPGYLQLRYGHATSGLSAITFAVMTILMSGVNMYAMAVVMQVILGWNIHFSIWVSSLTVGIYVALGGLFSAIFNEVIQFFLIWLGALLIPILGLVEAGGWSGMVARIHQNFPGRDFTHMWGPMVHPSQNPMGVQWVAIVFGLGAVLSMGYWTTDFLVVQRVIAAKDIRSAKTAPVIGAFFKMAVPFIVILPGLLGLAVLPFHLFPANVATAGQHTYDQVLPLMMARYLSPGLLGLGITALIAGFMSGMAGNISAFATVWTYDLYRPFIKKDATDRHYVAMGRWCTIIGLLISIGAAYIVTHFGSLMDYVQALFSFFIAPLFGTVIIGMLWKRATKKAGFWGLLAGITTAITTFALMRGHPERVAWFCFYAGAKSLAQQMWQAVWAFVAVVVVSGVVTVVTQPRPEAELRGLVMGLTDVPSEGHLPLVRRPVFWAGVCFVLFLILQWIFR
ncbi:MAG TPA: sodium:solute symporter family protein [Terriglobia bacterium]|nr:sodium:solute symporter family protein [Terriglobia bacterium]